MNVPDYKANRIKETKGKIIEYKEVRQFNKKFFEHGEVSKHQILEIIKKFNNNIINEATVNIYGVVLPENIGQILIANAGKSDKKRIDFNSSIKAGCNVYFKNWDTDNNRLRIMYFNNITNFVSHSNLFSFAATTSFRKIASTYFKKHWSRCVVINYKKKT